MRLCKLSATALAITTWCAGSSCAQAVRRSSTPSWHVTARCLSIPNRNRVEHVALLDLPVQAELYHDRRPAEYRRALRRRDGVWRAGAYWRTGPADSLRITLLYPFEQDQLSLRLGRRGWTGRFSAMSDDGYEEHRGPAHAETERCRDLPLVPPNDSW